MRHLSTERRQALSQALAEAAVETVLDRPLPKRAWLMKPDEGTMVLVNTKNHEPIQGFKPVSTAAYRH